MSYQFTTTTSLSEETYLESFVESISSSFPSELRRTLEHLRDLDNASWKLMEDWRRRQDICLKGVEDTLVGVFEGEALAANVGTHGVNNAAAAATAASSAAAADVVDVVACAAADGSGASVGNSSKATGAGHATTNCTTTNATTTSTKILTTSATITTSSSSRGTKRKHLPEKSPDKKVACVKCRARKVRCDGKRVGCLLRVALLAVPPTSSSDDTNDSSGTDVDPSFVPYEYKQHSKYGKQQQQQQQQSGGRNNDGKLLQGDYPNSYTAGKERQQQQQRTSSSSTSTTSSPISQSQLTEFYAKRGPPTTTEIQTILRTHNPKYESQREEIQSMYDTLKQFSSEKIDTANQLKSMVDMALGRLDRDLVKFEKELGIVDSSTNVGIDAVAGGVNTAVGGGMVGNTTIGGGGLVGTVGSHAHVGTGGAMAGASGVRHAVGHNSNAASMATSTTSIAPTTITTNNPNNTLRRSSANTPMPPPSINPTTIATQQHLQPLPTTRGIIPPPPKSIATSNLAAIQVTPNSPDWILAKILSHDKVLKTYKLIDEDISSNQIYKIPEKQVVVLNKESKWNRGDVVYAVYPDTTSFYESTVSSAPPSLNGYVMVQFKDDWDANGVTHEKAVLLAHVMKVPTGRR